MTLLISSLCLFNNPSLTCFFKRLDNDMLCHCYHFVSKTSRFSCHYRCLFVQPELKVVNKMHKTMANTPSTLEFTLKINHFCISIYLKKRVKEEEDYF
ncbi:uncharacterized protein B0P05DRAFT_300017 [Gilbertella persicaria]|uniref:uncharacterized protein n=1 Tax=Gilbertella persicaria TaxID=101096 RepID=UPI00221E4E28|nr:uncharacterized protein B0P05DRAFT_300017 [Gilbertella persicaria]KAI8091110.1 hypothetical protein B0P05DRAFT_300017 [Gilbertella persicaria]